MKDPVTIGDYTYDRAEYPNSSYPGPWHMRGKMGEVWALDPETMRWSCVSGPVGLVLYGRPPRNAVEQYSDWPTQHRARTDREIRDIEFRARQAKQALAAEVTP